MRAVNTRVKKLVAERLDDQLTCSIRSLAAEHDVELDDASVERLKGIIRWELGTKPSTMHRIDRLAWVVVANLDSIALARSSIAVERRYRKVGMQLRSLGIGLAEGARTTRPHEPTYEPTWEKADTQELDLLAWDMAAYRGLPTTEKHLSALRVELRDRIETEPSLKVLRDACMRKAKNARARLRTELGRNAPSTPAAYASS
jgi:hypothetical protein